MPIKAVVFDFGGVVMNYEGVDLLCEEIATKHGIKPQNLYDAMTEKTIHHQTDDKSLFNGTVTAEELETHEIPNYLAEKYNLSLPEGLPLFRTWLGQEKYVTMNECVMTAIKVLRQKGYKIYLLTNNFYVDKERKLPRTPVDYSLFDDVIESALEHCMKPYPKIYDITQKKIGPSISPSEVVFLDDLKENFEYPHKLGWKTIHVDKLAPNKAILELESLLGHSLSNSV